jgi:hypothetical protein
LALLLLASAPQPPDAVILIRDSDGQEERRIGLDQARQERPWPFVIAIGLAHLNRECWVLAGFEPQDAREQHLLTELKRELGFDPRLRPESLRGKPGEIRNAKLVLGRMVGESSEREETCWTVCDLETLHSRGKTTGLADYLDEVGRYLLPLFGRLSPP